MKIAVIGRGQWLYNTALQFIEDGFEIGLIITAQAPSEYEKKEDDFEKLADSLQIPFLCTGKINSQEIIDYIASLDPFDIAISVNYSGIIPKSVIGLFRLGILNAHGGDLPRYRGNACQAWAIINGEERVAMCIHKMIGGELDSGLIIAREYLSISAHSRIQEVYDWFDVVVPLLFLEAVKRLSIKPDYYLEKQSLDPVDALRCYPRSPEDGEIDWKLTNEQIVRLINASSEPYAGAFTSYKNNNMVIWRAKLLDDGEKYLAIPGQISKIDNKNMTIDVICGKGKIRIHEIEYQCVRQKPASVIKSIRSRFVSL